jgi:predicted DCC family thiol-disulfide oxidoreductase YuxK
MPLRQKTKHSDSSEILAQNKTPSNLVFYDGDCRFCNRFVRFTWEHDKNEKFFFCALQSQMAHDLLSKYGVEGEDLLNFKTLYYIQEKQLYRKSQAVFGILSQLNLLPDIFVKIAPLCLCDIGYDLVARMRKILPAGSSCAIPPEAVRRRFLKDD